ncbi:MAG: transketolase family protein [bacterium]
MCNKESMRAAFGQTLLELGRENPQIVALSADLSVSTKTSVFAREFPDRFFQMGVAEADMMGTAAGLATCGKISFASTFAIFASGRAWDQVRNTICYSKLNVKIVATHGGLDVGEDGASHQGIEDVALMRAIPTMRVVVPSDATQTREVIRKVAREEGPFYVRLVRSQTCLIYEKPSGFELGKAIRVRDGKHVTIMAMGPVLWEALEAAKTLAKEGIQARVVDMASIKPIDEEEIEAAASETSGIVSVEDHVLSGGLGSAIAEAAARRKAVRMRMVGIDDVFGQSGSPADLYREFGLTRENISSQARRLLDEK